MTDTAVTEPAAPDTDRVTRFVRRLAAEHRSRSPRLMAARRWSPGTVDVDVAALCCLDREPASAREYPMWAQTAKLWVIWHGGRADPAYGYPGEGIGRWAHRLGVGDPQAERIIARIAAANTPRLLDAALTALAVARPAKAPHWETVLAELTAWADPARRDHIRFGWARDFYSFPAKTTAPQDN